MKLKEFYLKYQTIIWPIAVGFSSILILVLVVIPQLLTYLNVRNQILGIRQKNFVLDTKAFELEEIDEEAAKENLQVVFTILPTDPEVLIALTVLQNQLTRVDLELKNTSFAGGKTGSKNSFQFHITVAGPITALRSWLISLQDAPRLFQIEALNVRFQKEQSGIEAEVPVSVFYQDKPKVMGSLDQPISKLNESEKQTLSKLTQIVAQTGIAQTDSGWDRLEATTSSVPLGRSDPFE